ncbi:MAG: P-loop NTPase [Candidatus Micrarchaeaceae archaeon]
MEENNQNEKNNPPMHPSFANVIRQKARVKASLAAIKHKIGVYSAKGGVGKTTIAVNLAYTLRNMGFKVGLLDADIDCPNITLFLGIEEKMVPEYPLKPLVKEGVKVASTAMVVDEVKKPIIWRGALITKMLGDFFENTDWGELDYLIIDLPPGTSDAPLTVMQLLDMDGFIIVTTPQKIAAINSIRSGLMAKRLNIAVLGVVENMSGKEASAASLLAAKELQTEMLGLVERNEKFAQLSDSGRIPIFEDGQIAAEFKAIAENIQANYQ